MGNATGSYGCGAPHDRGGNETKNANRLRAAATIQTAAPTATATRQCPCSAGPHAAATEIANPIPNTNAVGKVRGMTSSGPVAGRQSTKVMAAASPKTTKRPRDNGNDRHHKTCKPLAGRARPGKSRRAGCEREKRHDDGPRDRRSIEGANHDEAIRNEPDGHRENEKQRGHAQCRQRATSASSLDHGPSSNRPNEICPPSGPYSVL